MALSYILWLMIGVNLSRFCLTPANTDDGTFVPFLAKHFFGKLFGDRGYLSEKLTQRLATQNVELITTLRKNMKPKVLTAFDKLPLRKRSIIETHTTS